MTDDVSSLRLHRDRARRRRACAPRRLDDHGGPRAHARVALWLVWLAVAGCASIGGDTLVINKGGDGAGNFLASLAVVPERQIAAACGNPRALACMAVNTVLVWGDRVLDQFAMTMRWLPGIEASEYEVFVHEACHYVAGAYNIIPDPCHQEDHGMIRL